MNGQFISRSQFGTQKTNDSKYESQDFLTQEQILQRMTALETSQETCDQIHKNYQRLHALYFDQKTSIVSAVVLGYKDGVPYVYLVRRASDGFLCLPGGRLDPRGYGRQRASVRDETPLHAIVGEIREEAYATFDGFPRSLTSSFKCNFPLRFSDAMVRPRVEIFCFKVDYDDLVSGPITNNGETDGAFWMPLSEAFRSGSIKKYYKTSILQALRQRVFENLNQNKEERALKQDVQVNFDNAAEYALKIENTIPKFPLRTNFRTMQNAIRRTQRQQTAPLPGDIKVSQECTQPQD